MKAQLAVEFILIFAIFLAALTIIALSSLNKAVDISRSTIEREANTLLSKVANTINTVFLEGDGFAINLTLPEKIKGFGYNISIENQSIWLTMNQRSYHKRLLTNNVTGELKKGENLLKNVNGGIVIK